MGVQGARQALTPVPFSINGGQGESLVPPYTRRSISLLFHLSFRRFVTEPSMVLKLSRKGNTCKTLAVGRSCPTDRALPLPLPAGRTLRMWVPCALPGGAGAATIPHRS